MINTVLCFVNNEAWVNCDISPSLCIGFKTSPFWRASSTIQGAPGYQVYVQLSRRQTYSNFRADSRELSICPKSHIKNRNKTLDIWSANLTTRSHFLLLSSTILHIITSMLHCVYDIWHGLKSCMWNILSEKALTLNNCFSWIEKLSYALWIQVGSYISKASDLYPRTQWQEFHKSLGRHWN